MSTLSQAPTFEKTSLHDVSWGVVNPPRWVLPSTHECHCVSRGLENDGRESAVGASFRATSTGPQRYARSRCRDWRNDMKDELFEDLPLLLAVPKAARILGISRASAYRLVKSGELPTRRLGGRVYVVTACLRELGAA